MRQLFVPACLCLMTLSTSTGFDLPLDKFSAAAGDESVLPDGSTAPIDGPTVDLSSIDPSKIPLPPIPKPVVPRSREEICQTLSEAAQSNDLPLPFFIRLLLQESGFRSGVVSTAGAQGIAQFMPETSANEGVDNPFDPLQAIPASARLLRKLIAQFGNLGLAAAAYNAGPKRIQDWLEKKGALPEETQGYVKIVTGRPAETWKVASASGTELTLPYRAPCKEAVLPMPLPAPHRIVMASVEPGKPAASAHDRNAIGKSPATSQKPNKATPATRKAAAKAEKAVKPPARSRHKAPTQQLAARKHESSARKPVKVAQK